MGRIQYIVSEDQGQWFVEVKGQLYGPYESQEMATKDARRGASTVRNSEVLVQRGDTSPSEMLRPIADNQ